MDDEEMGYAQQVQWERAASQGSNPVSVRRYISGSIYLWACGEKGDDQDTDLALSDRFIGWLILFLQGLAYTSLAVRDQAFSEFDTDISEKTGEASGYSMASVTGAMYLLVASTTPDLRAGFSLLVDGSRVGHRVFGACLLTVYALMIAAAMKVLFSSANDDASMVMNAVAVLFIADLDEKALRFFLTVPAKWRLFWAIHSVGISFALALVAVVYAGDCSKVSNKDGSLCDNVPSWFIWVVNPGAVTLCSFVFSAIVQAFSDACGEAHPNVDMLAWGVLGEMFSLHFHAAMKGAKERLAYEPFFYASLSLWIADGVITWWFLVPDFWFPVAVDFPESSDSEDTESEDSNEGLKATENIVALLFSTMALVSGLTLVTFGAFVHKLGRVSVFPEVPRSFSETNLDRDVSVTIEDSRVPPLLVGWGVGYWVTSVLYLLGGAWHQGGWNNAPFAVSLLGYIVIPLCFLAAIFMVADTNFLGSRLGAFIEPTVKLLRNRRTVWYWIVATVLRNVFLLWILMWFVLMHSLNNF